MSTLIKAKKDLFNSGKCFTKGRIYEVLNDPYNEVRTEASLMEKRVLNDLDEEHLIGSWWREFTIVNK